jgi:signal transduction histidine kinase
MELPVVTRVLVVDAPAALVRRLESAGLEVIRAEDEPSARAGLARGEAEALILGSGVEQAARDARRRLAHDLRGPLALIGGHAELLEGPRVPDADRAESLAAIHGAARRLAELVDSRVEPPAGP